MNFTGEKRSPKGKNDMFRVIIGILFIFHGLVHLLYFGHSRRAFEMKPGMAWPDGAWAVSRVMDTGAVRNLAGIVCVTAGVLFAAGGIGLLAKIPIWRTVVLSASVVSSALFILFWDGTFRNMDGQGWVGVLINAVILLSVFVFRWPPLIP